MQTCFRIRELRQAAGMTQAELAAALELRSPSTVTMWESGARRPPSTIIPRLAELFHCTVQDIYRDTALEQDVENTERKETV